MIEETRVLRVHISPTSPHFSVSNPKAKFIWKSHDSFYFDVETDKFDQVMTTLMNDPYFS